MLWKYRSEEEETRGKPERTERNEGKRRKDGKEKINDVERMFVGYEK